MSFMLKICQTVVGISITIQFDEFFESRFWRVFAILPNCALANDEHKAKARAQLPRKVLLDRWYDTYGWSVVGGRRRLLTSSFLFLYLSIWPRILKWLIMSNFRWILKDLHTVLELAIADICFGFENQNTRALHIYKVNMLFSVLNFCLILMPNFSKIMTVWSCFVKRRIWLLDFW